MVALPNTVPPIPRKFGRRAAAVREATLTQFETWSLHQGALADLAKDLLELDQRNEWKAVFDSASVRSHSFRMPFNDKVSMGRAEKRPILPEGIWSFSFGPDGQVEHFWQDKAPNDLDHQEWLKQGSVRLRPDPSTGELPPLTNFTPLMRGWDPSSANLWGSSGGGWWASSDTHGWRSHDPSSGSGNRLTRGWEKKQANVQQHWLAEQTQRRRYWAPRDPKAFRDKLNIMVGDGSGNDSTFQEIQAKAGWRRPIVELLKACCWVASARRLPRRRRIFFRLAVARERAAAVVCRRLVCIFKLWPDWGAALGQLRADPGRSASSWDRGSVSQPSREWQQ
mmetsp:Transcript_151908/g.487532  ORF Transcript_151908/g.487532 Transcript_151908/m.487532 type:complete len:337 (+) Transcript_151908:133-1143(+)